MTMKRAVAARLMRRWVDLRSVFTVRRWERRPSTYALRLLCLALIVVVLPVKKAMQLGAAGALLAGLKVGVAVALVAGALALVFAGQEWARRRRHSA